MKRWKISQNGKKVFVQDWESLCCSYVWKNYKNEATAKATLRRLNKDPEATKRFYEKIREEMK